MFEKITKNKVRFNSVRGQLTIEDVWDLPLTKGVVNLDNMAKALSKELQESQESFVLKPKKKDDITKLKFDAIRHIISVKLDEIEKRKQEAENKARYAQIVDILAEKDVEKLKGKSRKELEKELKRLK